MNPEPSDRKGGFSLLKNGKASGGTPSGVSSSPPPSTEIFTTDLLSCLANSENLGSCTAAETTASPLLKSGWPSRINESARLSMDDATTKAANTNEQAITRKRPRRRFENMI